MRSLFDLNSGATAMLGTLVMPLVAAASAAAAASASTPPVVLSETLFTAPLPALLQHATQAKIPVAGIQLAPSRHEQVGDTVVALVSLSEGERLRQWLLRLEVVEATPAELSLPAPTAETWHTSTGSKITFEATRVAVAFRLIGPVRNGDRFRADKPPPDRTARALVRAGFLRLGFDRTASTLRRLDGMSGQEQGFNLGISNGAYAAEVVARDRPRALQLGLTPEDERAMVGAVPALFAFFEVVIKTPGLKEIFFEMIDKLSLGWSVLMRAGRMEPSFGFGSEGSGPADTARWDATLPTGHILTVPLALNGKPALNLQLVATRPEAPLIASAGLIGLHATNPGSDRRQLIIRVLAARPGPPPGAPPPPTSHLKPPTSNLLPPDSSPAPSP